MNMGFEKDLFECLNMVMNMYIRYSITLQTSKFMSLMILPIRSIQMR